MRKKVLSVVITAHKEGLFLNKTLLSISNGLNKIKDEYEIIINLDNSDKETNRIAKIWEDKDENIKAYKVSFGNPADNRNDGINKAKGTYICVIDGDDLLSGNWFKKGLEEIKKHKKDVILRPELHLQFGYNEYKYTIWKMRSSSDKATDAIQLAYWNLWTACLIAKKDILKKVPYKPALNGFGYEDYLFCADTRALDIEHIIVPETVVYYRRRSDSVSTEHINTILEYSDLFDIDYFKSLPFNNIEIKNNISKKFKVKLQRNFKRGYRFAFDTAKKVHTINNLIAPSVREILYNKNLNKIGKWVVDDLKEINKIENQLYPTKGNISLLGFHPLSFNPYENSYGVMYQKLCRQLTGNKIDYLFLAPAMSGRGGTEKLIANYIKAIKKNYPNWNIAILSTKPYNELTLDYFKNLDVDMLDFGRITLGVGSYEKDIIWSRLLVQSKVKRLHIVNDEYWYRWISRRKKLIINNNYKVFVSLFMREFTHEKDRILTFADPHISENWEAINKVFTDNRKVIDEALENNAFNKEKMIVHYQPQDFSEMKKPKIIDNSKPIRILWASRISYQKRPDLLKKITAKLGDDYIVDAYGIFDESQIDKKFFNGSKVNYKGKFNGISSIDTSQYDIYLYTSQTDGVPNILMEVISEGLPIVASNIGGISEVVKEGETGKLVDLEDLKGYVNAIEELRNNPELAKKYATNAQSLVKEQHSWDKFYKVIKQDIA